MLWGSIIGGKSGRSSNPEVSYRDWRLMHARSLSRGRLQIILMIFSCFAFRCWWHEFRTKYRGSLTDLYVFYLSSVFVKISSICVEIIIFIFLVIFVIHGFFWSFVYSKIFWRLKVEVCGRFFSWGIHSVYYLVKKLRFYSLIKY